MQSPKHINKPFQFRNQVIGKFRRENYTKITCVKQPHFPKTVQYEDIDKAVYEFADKELEITYNEFRFPTFKLFSNQRISEYKQEWSKIDEKGNLEINFKTLTREMNPQKGELYASSYNIPGDRFYPVFQVPVLEENGDEVMEVYSMRQPYCVNLIYSFTIYTVSINCINRMNEMVQKAFSALQHYIFPNGFAMPMMLNSVSDESETLIDDRKYYSQTFQFKVLAFIIRDEDYKVTKMRTRHRNMFFVGGKNSDRRHVKKEKYNIDQLSTSENKLEVETINNSCSGETKLRIDKEEINYDDIYDSGDYSDVDIDDVLGVQSCWQGTDDEIYVNKKVIINSSFKGCKREVEFEMDSIIQLESIDITNVKSYNIYINDKKVELDGSDIIFYEGDSIKIDCEPKDDTQVAYVKLICFDTTSIVDTETDDDTTDEVDF
jgi:hypothetical protein